MVRMPPERKSKFRSRLYGWWYILIGAGFILLGVNRLLIGDRSWTVWLRGGIAAGFFALAYFELRDRLG